MNDEDFAALLMKTSDLSQSISQSLIFKRFGVRGARFFVKIWFSIMYLILVAATATFWFVGAEPGTGWRRIFVGCLIGALIVLTSSLLTQVLLRFLAGIEQLESQSEKAQNVLDKYHL